VHAHILAAIQLLEADKAVAGKPYFVSDCEPINNFEFFRPLLEGLGYSFPVIRMPVWVMYYVALTIEFVHWLCAPVYNFQPLLTRAEIYKVSVTHYFKPDRAREDLGYRPLVPMKTGMDRVVTYYQRQRSGKAGRPASSGLLWKVAIGVALCCLVSYFFRRIIT